MKNVAFRGLSGECFYFQAWPLETRFKAVGGVYIVTRRMHEDSTFSTRATHQPLVIGHTDDLADGLLSAAQRAKLAAQNGANCLCVCAVADPARRSTIEMDLIAGNEHFRGMLQSLTHLADGTTRTAHGTIDIAYPPAALRAMKSASRKPGPGRLK